MYYESMALGRSFQFKNDRIRQMSKNVLLHTAPSTFDENTVLFFHCRYIDSHHGVSKFKAQIKDRHYVFCSGGFGAALIQQGLRCVAQNETTNVGEDLS